jgi:aspartyl protease family protein
MRFELDFMVDTGASFCVLRKDMAQRLALNFDAQKTTKIVTASRQDVFASIAPVAVFRVGGILVQNLSMSIFDLPEELGVPGLIGMNFLSKFRMCIEPDTATLVLRKLHS